MKKTFNSGKIWTLLSALIFFLTCGLFVAALPGGLLSDESNFSGRRTETMGDILTKDKWNELMYALDELTIPDGAIMAFDSTGGCPEGWTEYAVANGRFLMGATSGIGTTTGSNTIQLTAPQLPMHSHVLVYRLNKGSGGGNSGKRPTIVNWSDKKGPGLNSVDPDESFYESEMNTGSYRTAPEGSNAPINITNASVKVLYCIKGAYVPKQFTVEIIGETGGNVDIDSVTSTINSDIYSDFGGTLHIGTWNVRPAAADGYSFGSWNTVDCGNKLIRNCNIYAHFKPNSTCTFEYYGMNTECPNDGTFQTCAKNVCKDSSSFQSVCRNLEATSCAYYASDKQCRCNIPTN